MTAAGDRPWTLIYDGECRFCIRTVNLIRDRDRDALFELIPYQSEGVKSRFPQIAPEAFEESVQLIGPDRERWEGAAAVERVLTLLPRTGWLAWLFRIPLIRPIAEWAYRLISRNRHRFGCGDHCPIT